MKSRRRPAATISDIGRELGLSAMTVSRALNGSPQVSEETRRKVLGHAERVNYRPNRWARSLVTQRSHIIGMVVPDISHSFFSEITRSVQETLERRGYDLMLCHTHADVRREDAAINMLLGSRVDGLIVASERPEHEPGIFRELQVDGTPFILLDRCFANLRCACVRTDDRAVGRLATEHLIELRHTRIAHIRGPGVSVGRLRFEGYIESMERHGLATPGEYVVDSSFGSTGGQEAMRQLLALPEPPTAVFATNDPAAIGAIHACREAGLDVPRDISVVGAGRIEGALHPNPFLTTVDWSRQALGEKAAEYLLAAIEGHVADSVESIEQPTLVVRSSTAPLQ